MSHKLKTNFRDNIYSLLVGNIYIIIINVQLKRNFNSVIILLM